MFKQRIAVVLAALLILPSTGVADDQPQRFNETVNVGYVVVPFVAVDRDGRPLQTLRQRDVKLLVDGAEVQYDMFEHVGNLPVSYTILLDGSGSMGLSGKMDGARMAIRELLSRARPGDDFALHVFAEGEVTEVVPFTTKVSEIAGAINKVEPYGKTAFFDALSKMPDRSLLGNNGSRAIILLTDGFDNASALTGQQLHDILAGVDVPVYPLGIRPEVSADPEVRKLTDALLDVEILSEIAQVTGGRLAVVDEPLSLRLAIIDIEKELRSQYLIGFSPTGHGSVRYRKIALQLPRRARSVHVRGGYRGTEPPLRSRSR
jgi:VWFA-related protein